MNKSTITAGHITFALRRVEAGTQLADVCRQTGIAEATSCFWKKKYADLGVLELPERRQLGDDYARFRRVLWRISPWIVTFFRRWSKKI